MSARVSAAMLRALRLVLRGYTIRQAALLAGVHRRSLQRALARAGRHCTNGAQADTSCAAAGDHGRP